MASSQRPHPVYILYDAKRWLPLLLIPVMRILFSPLDALNILVASLRDVGITLLLVGISFLRWFNTEYCFHQGLWMKQGIFFKRVMRVRDDDAASIEQECSPLMWLTRSRRIRINTAGLRSRADATLYLGVKRAARLMYRSSGSGQYYARPILVSIMAASSSNAAIGLLTIAPTFRQASRIAGERLTNDVYNLAGRLLQWGLPPFLEGIANILVLGWAYSFIRSLFRYGRFKAERRGENIHLVSGILTQRDVQIDFHKITALEFRQTLFMRLFRLHTATVNAAGYGREKGTRPVIIPAAHLKEMCAALDRLLPDYPLCESRLRPMRRSLSRYILPPFWVVVASVAIISLFTQITTMVALAVIGFGVWWFIIRLLAYFSAGFGVSRDAITMRYSRGLALYEVHIPIEVADCAVITQSPWQVRSGSCTVEIRCYGEKRRRHKVLALPYLQARALVEKLNHYANTQEYE